MWKCELRTTRATAAELKLMLEHRARGTSPGNPKWYKTNLPPRTFNFKSNAAPVFPSTNKAASDLVEACVLAHEMEK